MVTPKKLHALEGAAIVQLDFTHTEVGHRFKFICNPLWDGAGRWNFAIGHRLMPEPFPNPAGFHFVRLEMQHKQGILSFAMFAVVVFIPVRELVNRLVGIEAIDEGFG